MNEPAGLPPLVQSPAPPRKKFPVWAIVLIVVVVLCCCCVGVVGLAYAFWAPISQELGISSILPLLSNL